MNNLLTYSGIKEGNMNNISNTKQNYVYNGNELEFKGLKLEGENNDCFCSVLSSSKSDRLILHIGTKQETEHVITFSKEGALSLADMLKRISETME